MIGKNTTTSPKANPLSFVCINRDDRGEIVSGNFFVVPDETYLQGYLTGMKAVGELVQWIKTSTDTHGFKSFVVCEIIIQVSLVRNNGGPAHGVPNKRGAAAALAAYVVELMMKGANTFDMSGLHDRIAVHEQKAIAVANEGSAA